jgi:hypothetical protein
VDDGPAQGRRVGQSEDQINQIYHKITKINLYVDDDPEPVVAELRPDGAIQEVPLAGKRASASPSRSPTGRRRGGRTWWESTTSGCTSNATKII